MQSVQQPVDLAARVRVAENGQAERRLCNEDIARHRLERSARRVLSPLVIAGDHDPLARMFEDDLGRSENVTGWHESDVDLADPHRFAVSDRIAGLFAVAGGHNRQGLRRRPHLGMPTARMIGMAMRDEGLGLRLRRIDPRIRGAYVDAFGKRLYPGTEAGHRELYSQDRIRFPLGGKLHGRNAAWADGNRRSRDPSDLADMGGGAL